MNPTPPPAAKLTFLGEGFEAKWKAISDAAMKYESGGAVEDGGAINGDTIDEIKGYLGVVGFDPFVPVNHLKNLLNASLICVPPEAVPYLTEKLNSVQAIGGLLKNALLDWLWYKDINPSWGQGAVLITVRKIVQAAGIQWEGSHFANQFYAYLTEAGLPRPVALCATAAILQAEHADTLYNEQLAEIRIAATKAGAAAGSNLATCYAYVYFAWKGTQNPGPGIDAYAGPLTIPAAWMQPRTKGVNSPALSPLQYLQVAIAEIEKNAPISQSRADIYFGDNPDLHGNSVLCIMAQDLKYRLAHGQASQLPVYAGAWLTLNPGYGQQFLSFVNLVSTPAKAWTIDPAGKDATGNASFPPAYGPADGVWPEGSATTAPSNGPLVAGVVAVGAVAAIVL